MVESDPVKAYTPRRERSWSHGPAERTPFGIIVCPLDDVKALCPHANSDLCGRVVRKPIGGADYSEGVMETPGLLFENKADSPQRVCRATWVPVGNHEGLIGQSEVQKAGTILRASSPQLPWTDDYSSLSKVIISPGAIIPQKDIFCLHCAQYWNKPFPCGVNLSRKR